MNKTSPKQAQPETVGSKTKKSRRKTINGVCPCCNEVAPQIPKHSQKFGAMRQCSNCKEEYRTEDE
jgi:hypothetical protein